MLAAELRDAEHAADESTHEIMRRLNQTFVTPFDRHDIYGLASGLDDCMDHMEEAGDLIVLYKLGALPNRVNNQVDVLRRCAEVTADAMPRLRSMKDLADYWVEINRLENEADKSYRKLLAELFNGGIDPIELMKLKDVVDALEAAADSSSPWRTSSRRSPSRSPERWRSRSSSWSWRFALGFDYTNGFHDAANAIATSVSTRALTPRVALVMAAVFNFLGALLGTAVAKTIGSGIIDLRRVGIGPPGAGHGPRGGGRRDRVEPHHLVEGAAVLLLARPDRCADRGRRGGGRDGALGGDPRQGRHPDGGLAAWSGSAWRSW